MAAVQVVWEIILWVFILQAFADFLPPVQNSGPGRLVKRVTDPVLAPVRLLFRPFTVGETTIDLSAVIVVLVLYYLHGLIF